MSLLGRKLEDVEAVINYAKLDSKDLESSTRILSFESSLYDHSKYKLLEVRKDVLDKMLSGESPAAIKGLPEDSAVFCTASSTFDIKEAEISNNMLIIPDLKPNPSSENRTLVDLKILGSFNRFMELKECSPRLRRLEEFLLESPYSKITYQDSKGYSTEELLESIQCSEGELRNGLAELGAVSIEGKWFLLDSDYLMRVMTLIDHYIEENSWSRSSLKMGETLQVLSEIEPYEILEQVINIFAPGDGDIRGLDQDKVCRFYGKYLLDKGPSFELDEFLKMWRDIAPEGFETKLSHLRGLALISNRTIRPFPESSLPNNIQQRLEVLFHVREKWNLEDITPYIEKLCDLKSNVNALLTKHARSSREDGVKYFSAKHGK